MTENLLVRLFEHNNWANGAIVDACVALSDEQLDTTPLSSSPWSVRFALTHLVSAQQGYLALLTQPVEARLKVEPAFTELSDIAKTSGDELLRLARDESSEWLGAIVRSTDGYEFSRWVALVQVVNHAGDHRRQVCDMFRALDVTPPQLDGWGYGEAAGAVHPRPS